MNKDVGNYTAKQYERPSETRLPVFQTAFIYRLRMGLTAYAFDFCAYAAEFFSMYS